MATESNTDRKPPAEIAIWYQLIISNEVPSRPSSVVVDSTTNIDNLCDEIKNKKPNDLRYVDADRLTVYPPGTRFDDNWNPKDGRTAHDPWDTVPQVEFSGNVPQPLIVLVPKFTDQSTQKVSFVFVV